MSAIDPGLAEVIGIFGAAIAVVAAAAAIVANELFKGHGGTGDGGGE